LEKEIESSAEPVNLLPSCWLCNSLVPYDSDKPHQMACQKEIDKGKVELPWGLPSNLIKWSTCKEFELEKELTRREVKTG